MTLKRINIVWAISLLVIGIATVVLAGARVLELGLPDMIVRVLGILELVAIPFLVYTSVRILKK